jgi:mannose-6-phosphate isomerase-like protein (cupin superfamily)
MIENIYLKINVFYHYNDRKYLSQDKCRMSIYIDNIEKQTIQNKNYRHVIYTTKNNKMQLVLMTLQPGDDIPFETHADSDQFIRIESGNGKLTIDYDGIQREYDLSDGIAFIIPAGTRHRVRNIGESELSLYSIYTPANHPPDSIDKKRSDSIRREMSGGSRMNLEKMLINDPHFMY